MSKIAIINVGANAASRPLRSPIFGDRTFEFVPTKTDNPYNPPGFDTFAGFKSVSGRSINEFIPRKFLSKSMHNDPEFISHTYGDWPEKESRSRNLRKLNPGDSLYYLARLVDWNNGNWGKPGFYLVGKLVLDKIIKKSDLMHDPSLISIVQNNAHVKRWLIEEKTEEENFWILVGSDGSKRFVHAVPFDRNIVDKVLLAANGTPIKWDYDKTNLQTIGSYTRTCRIIDNLDRIKILEAHVREYC